MKKSKIILLYSIIIFLLIIYASYTFIFLKNESKYNKEKHFIVKVLNYKIKDNKLTIIGKGKEKILLNYYFEEKPNIKIGSTIEVTGNILLPNKNSNFYLFNYRNYLLSKKIKRIILVDKIIEIDNKINIEYKLKNSLIRRINKINNKYINLFVIGENELDKNIKNSFSNNGISHLFAISGMHISLFTLIITKILEKIINKKQFIIIVVSMFLILYMFVTNYSPSIVRSSLLYIGINIFKKSSFTTLLNILIILLFLNPFYLYDIGFNFSFIISFFLIIFSNKINIYNNYFLKLFHTSLISFLASIPILIINFHQINFLTILNNLIFVPIISIIVFPLSLLVLIFPKINIIFNYIIIYMEKLSLFFNKINILTFTFHHIDIIILIFYYILIILIIKKNYLNKYLIVFILILFIHNNINYFNKTPSLTILDVGQGDCILLSLPNNNILIDTGGGYKKALSDNIIVPYLKAEGIKKINYLIITHGDYDHMGESIDLVNNFKIENVIFNIGSYNNLELKLINTLKKKNIKYLKNIKTLNIDKYKLYFVNIKDHKNENDNSNVIYFKINNIKLLFMGDAGIKQEQEIIKNYNLTDIDILKVGHHGSNTSSSKNFINHINPKNCLISVGKNNRYNHPKESVLKIMDKCNIYRTDLNGSIKIKLKNNYKIKTIS